MSVLLMIISLGLFLLLVVTSAMQPKHAPLSLFELRRRKDAGDSKAIEMLQREEMLAQLRTLSAPTEALLLIFLTVLFSHLLGWYQGLFAAIGIALLYTRIAHLAPVRRLADKLYVRNEARLLGTASKYKSLLRFVSGKALLKEKRTPLGSHEELSHMLEASRIFSDKDRQLLKSALRFQSRLVRDSMTPKDAIISVMYTELLGPLVLDDLHKTGHIIFPVIKGKEIVGLLDSSDHVALRSKESVHVRDVMRSDIAKISPEATLDEALETFVNTRQPLLVVVDDVEIVGILSLGDTVRALLGR